MKKGILFDLDGTLWEVTDNTYNCACEVAKKNNLKEVSYKTVYKCFGLSKIDCAKAYFPYLDSKTACNLIEEISLLTVQDLHKNGGYLYPNLQTVLKELSNEYELYIVSNTSLNEYIEAFLKYSNSKELFTDYIPASKFNISKGDAIKKIITNNNLEKAVYVGDTILDLKAAEFANIPFIHAKYGYDKDLKTNFYLDSINDLPMIVNKIFS